MKTLLRCLALGAAVCVTLLASRAEGVSYVTCRTTCTGSGTITTVTATASLSTCCAPSYNPCPAGTTPAGSTYTPGGGGLPRFCGPR